MPRQRIAYVPPADHPRVFPPFSSAEPYTLAEVERLLQISRPRLRRLIGEGWLTAIEVTERVPRKRALTRGCTPEALSHFVELMAQRKCERVRWHPRYLLSTEQINAKPFFPLREVRSMLGCTYRTLHRLVDCGALPTITDPGRARTVTRIRAIDLINFIGSDG